MTKIFGYGSLININSIKKTIPDVISISPAILNNYIRIFNAKAKHTFSNEQPICVLNIKESKNSKINGVLIEISEENYKLILKREEAYETKEVTINNEKAIVFISKSELSFLFNDIVQMNYLQTCLDGAKHFGEEFYNMFLETTFINNKSLKELFKH